jgi:hypothetical protein
VHTSRSESDIQRVLCQVKLTLIEGTTFNGSMSKESILPFPFVFNMQPVDLSHAELVRGLLQRISRVMRNQNKVLLFVVVLTAGLSAQEVRVGPQPANVGQVMGERDKGTEDKIAKLFEKTRSDLKILKLARIRHRDSLEQRVCTIALTGTLPKQASIGVFGFYKTAQPDAISAELYKVASFNDLHPKYNPSYARYSVAVWRAKDSQTGETTYWVGVYLYWSAAMEFVDYHFTDDIYYHNNWKKTIAPQCRGK